MAALFGNTWVSSYGDSPAGIAADTWSKALVGLQPIQIADGLRETLVLGSDFPPSAPRFRRLCFGIPSLQSVKGIMRRREYDRFVALVFQHLDTYVFSRSDQRSADRMLKEAYDTASEYVMRGGALPEPPLAEIEAPTQPERKPAPPEVAKPYIEQLSKLLGETEDAPA